MESLALLTVLVLLIALAVGAVCCRVGPLACALAEPREPAPPAGAGAGPGAHAGAREHYGPPPGMVRALSHYELGDRGWPSYPWEYNANTASAISGLIERSA